MNKVSLDILKSHLWESANILRGSIDAADYKNYIFGMLFLKRLSDVFEEEAERIERETGNKKIAWNDPDEHEFFVPEKARWDHIKAHTQNLGEILNKANEALEERTTITLEDVLTATDFNDKDRLPMSCCRS
jgi:type I restriction enzyme M protein